MSSLSVDSGATSVVSGGGSSGGGATSPPVGSVPAPSSPFPSGATAAVFIDDTDVTSCCVAGSWNPRLNRPAQASITMPYDCAPFGDCGSRLRIYLDTGSGLSLVFHGFILNRETDMDKDTGTTVYNAQDPMELWQWRLVRDGACDFANPAILNPATFGFAQANQALWAALNNSIFNDCGNGGPPIDAEGPIFLDIGAFPPAPAGPDITGAPVDWPMTISDFAALLISTGQLDAVITPIETDANGNIGSLALYGGNYGTDLSGSVVFSYGMGDFNIQALRWNRDMTSMVNKYEIFAGPRMKPADDPEGLEHWCFNVQGQDGGSASGFPGPPNGLAYPPGGQAVDASNSSNFGLHSADDGWTSNPIGERAANSRTTYGVRQRVDILDQYDGACVPGLGTVGHELARRQWQIFQYFAATPRELLHITPTRDTQIGSFGIGDLVGIQIVSDVNGGLGLVKQRIYEYTVSWSGSDSVLELSELQTSADAEGM